MTSMRRPVLIFLLAVAALSCSRPSSQEPFVTREKAEYGDTYNFTLPMDDSTRSYSLAFYTRLERKPLVPFSTDSVILEVRFVSPSDSVVQDKVVMRFGHPSDSSYYSRDFVFRYKDRLEVGEYGDWRLKVRVPGNPEELRGMGIIFRRK